MSVARSLDFPDLILTGWTAGRRTPLELYGPTGLRSMTEHILQAYRIDIETRTNRVDSRPLEEDLRRVGAALTINIGNYLQP